MLQMIEPASDFHPSFLDGGLADVGIARKGGLADTLPPPCCHSQTLDNAHILKLYCAIMISQLASWPI